MESGLAFDAPWGSTLRWVSGLATLGLAAMSLIGYSKWSQTGNPWLVVMMVVPVVILAIAAFYTVRGYELTPEKLIVQRLGWKTEFALDDLRSAQVDPKATQRSIRTFGNGGLYSFTGKFRNEQLGPYRAFMTDPKLAVVLSFGNETIVVTPENPEALVAAIER